MAFVIGLPNNRITHHAIPISPQPHDFGESLKIFICARKGRPNRSLGSVIALLLSYGLFFGNIKYVPIPPSRIDVQYMASIGCLPLEIVSRIFKLLTLEDAWSARQVCRYWRSVFDFCASGSEKVYLRGIVVTVDIICGIKSASGKVIDNHFIHGELSLDTSIDTPRDMAKWRSQRRQCEYWPGGRWRMYTIKEALTAVNLMFSNCPWNTPDILVQIDRNVDVVVGSESTETPCDDTFTLHIGRAKEILPNGRLFENHSIVAVAVPLKKLFALLVRHTRKSREVMEVFMRHYNFATQKRMTDANTVGRKKFGVCCMALRESLNGACY